MAYDRAKDRRMTVDVSKDMHAQITKYRQQNELISQSEVIRRALQAFFAQPIPQEK